MQSFLNRCFHKEEINGAGTCPTYFFRWTLFSCPWFKVYLHHFIGEDWSQDPHDHPKNFISIGLKGWYYEHIYNQGAFVKTERFVAPWFRWFPAAHAHRIQAKNCWTLCLVGRAKREWGFFYRQHPDATPFWILWNSYVKLHGKERKSC